MRDFQSFPDNFRALVFGSSGGIGGAVCEILERSPKCAHVERVSRAGDRPFDLTDETSLAELADSMRREGEVFHLIFDATGTLTIDGKGPEKALSALDPDLLAKTFAINAIGPALLFKHCARLLPRGGKSVFATLSARVGSIGDNRLGGWYGYRAAKAALNQIVRSASIEIARSRPEAVCLALHPGTVETELSRPFSRGRFTHGPLEAAARLLEVVDLSTAEQTGTFQAYNGETIPW